MVNMPKRESSYMTTHSYVVPIYRKPPVQTGEDQEEVEVAASPATRSSLRSLRIGQGASDARNRSTKARRKR